MDSSLFIMILAAICSSSCITGSLSTDSSYSHDPQKEDYHVKFNPSACSDSCTVTPFFSPEHSMDVYLALINEANEAIDIFQPSWPSWSGCSTGNFDDIIECIGCSFEEQFNEDFPLFSALVNAVNIRGISVRLVTNNDVEPKPTCNDYITPMDWMTLVGMEIKHYKTTTAVNAKFISIDSGHKLLISSVDFSKASFTENREAGVILSNCKCKAINLFKNVFENDFDNGYDYLLSRAYSAAEMQYVTRQTELPLGNQIGPFIVSGAFRSNLTPVDKVKIRFAYVTPDNARNTLLQTLKVVRKSIKVHIYQIKSVEICDSILSLIVKGVDVKLLVSSDVYNDEDLAASQHCYSTIYHDGSTRNGTIRNSYDKFKYSHQNYWIMDDSVVMLSTGDWTPSSYPEGEVFKPYSTSNVKVIRDMVVAMESSGILEIYNKVFDEDWVRGLSWTHVHEHDSIITRPSGHHGSSGDTTCTAGSGNCDFENTAAE